MCWSHTQGLVRSSRSMRSSSTMIYSMRPNSLQCLAENCASSTAFAGASSSGAGGELPSRLLPFVRRGLRLRLSVARVGHIDRRMDRHAEPNRPPVVSTWGAQCTANQGLPQQPVPQCTMDRCDTSVLMPGRKSSIVVLLPRLSVLRAEAVRPIELRWFRHTTGSGGGRR